MAISDNLKKAIDAELAEGTTAEEIINVLSFRAMSRSGMQVVEEVKQYISSLSK